MGAWKFENDRYKAKSRVGRVMGSLGNDGFRAHPIHARLEENWLKLPQLATTRVLAGGDSAGTLAAAALCNPYFVIDGTNHANADVTRHAGSNGVNMVTHGSNNDIICITPDPLANNSSWVGNWVSDNTLRFECLIKTGAAVTAQAIYAGFKLTKDPVVATDNDQFFIKFATTEATSGASTTTWNVFTSRTDVDVVDVANAPAVAAATFYRLALEIDVNRKPSAYIGIGLTGQLQQVPLSTAGGAALTTAITFIPFVGIKALTGAAKTLIVAPGFSCSRLMQ